jgi:serine/threonine protein kinase
MQHPNAVTVTDFGATEDGYLYIVMELLEGRTLRDLLAHEAPLDPARAVSIMLQTCAAVGAAHDAGLIHRDLKPANIFIEQRPNLPALVKVLDFGVAKFVVEEHDDDYNTLTQVGAIIGTPRYMSPEQCSGAAALTPASDVYSLGIIFYEMLTGVAPFNAETPLGVALKQVSEAPQSLREIVPSIPPELEGVVFRALAKNPEQRPQNANDFRRELHATADDLGLEHSGSTTTTFENLRSAGTESPSGRLVIDLATLRQVQAASGNQTEEQKVRTSAKTKVETARRPVFDRLNVPLVKEGNQNRARLVIAAAVLLIALLGSGIIAARWWRSSDHGNGLGLLATASPSPSPTATPSPTPTPTPTPAPKRSSERRRSAPPSKLKKVWNKVKGIFG